MGARKMEILNLKSEKEEEEEEEEEEDFTANVQRSPRGAKNE
jgi:hypothetical protein